MTCNLNPITGGSGSEEHSTVGAPESKDFLHSEDQLRPFGKVPLSDSCWVQLVVNLLSFLAGQLSSDTIF